MKFQFDEVVGFSVDTVYTTLRDRTPELVPYLPEVDHIETLERVTQADGRLRLTNLWQGNKKSAPVMARPFLTKQMMCWRDVATWDHSARCLHWKFETMHMESLFSCSGTNYFEHVDDATCKMRFTGDIETYLERVPGISPTLGRRLAPKADRWLVNMLMPNIARLPVALNALLAQH